jgi:hypothetical protein
MGVSSSLQFQQLKREPGKGLLVGGVKLPLALAELKVSGKHTPQRPSGSHAGLPVGSLQALTHFRSSTTLLPHLFFPELWTAKPSCNTVLTRTPMI